MICLLAEYDQFFVTFSNHYFILITANAQKNNPLFSFDPTRTYRPCGPDALVNSFLKGPQASS
jgi:hypothetical protein